MKKILVLGGTRFIGKLLVKNLVDAGNDVTILTRGFLKDPFGDRITRVIGDRKDRDVLFRVAKAKEWDTVYDQVCFSPLDALIACKAFSGRTRKYILTSSQVVYDSADYAVKENEYNPITHEYNLDNQPDSLSYEEMKRAVEAVFFKNGDFPLTAVRFSIVLGENDHTKRLSFHFHNIINGLPIRIPFPKACLSLISVQEAASFLAWLSDKPQYGPMNACSDGVISLINIIKLIEDVVGRPAIIVPSAEGPGLSPYVLKTGNWFMDNLYAKRAGFVFSSIQTWLPELIIAHAAQIKKGVSQ